MSAETDRLAQIKASALMDEPGGSFVVALAERLLTQVEALTAERDRWIEKSNEMGASYAYGAVAAEVIRRGQDHEAAADE